MDGASINFLYECGYELNAFVRVSPPSRIALAESARETVSLPRLAMLSTCFFLSRARDFTTFTLHDLTIFYVEMATVPHYNKLSFMFS